MLQQTYAHRLDANMLKLIAILAMTADHLAWLLFPGYSTVPIALFLHVIGRSQVIHPGDIVRITFLVGFIYPYFNILFPSIY